MSLNESFYDWFMTVFYGCRQIHTDIVFYSKGEISSAIAVHLISKCCIIVLCYMLYVTQLLELFARSLTMEKKKKMKNWVMVRPRKPKEWVVLVLMLATVLPTISPMVNFFNKPVIILGLPLLFWLAIGALVAVIIVLNIAYRWGVH